MKTNSKAALPGSKIAAALAGLDPKAGIRLPDEAIGFREVYARLGLNCKTAHTALTYARKGWIRAIRINARTIRYSRRSVDELIAGNLGGIV